MPEWHVPKDLNLDRLARQSPRAPHGPIMSTYGYRAELPLRADLGGSSPDVHLSSLARSADARQGTPRPPVPTILGSGQSVSTVPRVRNRSPFPVSSQCG
jgi:hypothetical protein